MMVQLQAFLSNSDNCLLTATGFLGQTQYIYTDQDTRTRVSIDGPEKVKGCPLTTPTVGPSMGIVSGWSWFLKTSEPHDLAYIP